MTSAFDHCERCFGFLFSSIGTEGVAGGPVYGWLEPLLNEALVMFGSVSKMRNGVVVVVAAIYVRFLVKFVHEACHQFSS